MIIVTPSRLDEEGRIVIVTTRGVRDAVDAMRRQTCDVLRTAKACGPGTPGLVLSPWIGDVGPFGPDAPRSAGDGDYEVMDTGESAR